jgi:hypothetical protein
MSISERKQSIFATIGSLSSLHDEKEITKLKSTYKSVKTKSNDEIAFLLDVLKQVVGGALLKEMIGGLLTDFFTKVESEMKEPLKKQFTQGNSGDQIPASFKNGIQVPIKSIDSQSKFKIKSGTISEDLKFNNVIPDFDTKVRSAYLNQVPQEYCGLSMSFDQVTQSLTFKPTTATENFSIGKWFSDYIDAAAIINKKEVVTNILDAIFGTMAKTEDKSIDQIINELKLQETINNMLDDDNNPLNLNDIIDAANALKNGTVEYNLGCGYIYNSLTPEFFSGATTTISSSNDPTLVGNAVESCITNGENPDTIAIIDENSAAARDGYFARIINMIKEKIINALVMSPQIVTLRAIMGTLTSGNQPSPSTTILEEVGDAKQFIKCLAPVFVNMMVDYILAIVVSELSKLLSPIIQKLVKEKTNQVKRIIQSLIPTKLVKI